MECGASAFIPFGYEKTLTFEKLSFRTLPTPTSSLVRKGVPHGQTESGGIVLAVMCGARAPRGGVNRKGVVFTDLQSLLDRQ